jgi:hypothetical protein
MTLTEKRKIIIVPILIIIGCIIAVSPFPNAAASKPLICVEYSKVVSIDSITYRGGRVTLENGNSFNVGQMARYEKSGAIRVGKEYCVRKDYK